MPKVSLQFWGMLKNGRLHSVYSSEGDARKAIFKVDPCNEHNWEIMPVQVIYRQPELPGVPARDEEAIKVGGAIYEETCQIAQDDEASGHLTLHATRFMRLGRAALNAINPL